MPILLSSHHSDAAATLYQLHPTVPHSNTVEETLANSCNISNNYVSTSYNRSINGVCNHVHITTVTIVTALLRLLECLFN